MALYVNTQVDGLLAVGVHGSPRRAPWAVAGSTILVVPDSPSLTASLLKLIVRSRAVRENPTPAKSDDERHHTKWYPHPRH